MPDMPEEDEQVQVKRGRGRPRKYPLPEEGGPAASEKPKKGFLGLGGKEGSVLSKAEVAMLNEPFRAALKDDCRYLDEFLWWYSKDESHPQIWSDLDREEIDTLATVLLRRAERSPAAATFVRNVVDGSDYIGAAIITVPRFIMTMQQVGKRPKQPKREKRAKA